MPSPFPGMNPFFEHETVWHGFHQRFMAKAADFLTPQVRPAYYVDIDSNVYLHELPAEERRLLGRPDVLISETGERAATRLTATMQTNGGVRAAVPVAVDKVYDSFVEIRDTSTRIVVTVIELLSPTTKTPGSDRASYLAKRERCLASPAHLVELDLLRGGPRMPIVGLPPCDYCSMVSRASTRPDAIVWPVALRDPLLPIPIPLRGNDPDAVLDLKQVLDAVYDAAGYEDILYSVSPEELAPSLRADDAAWARALIPGSIRSRDI